MRETFTENFENIFKEIHFFKKSVGINSKNIRFQDMKLVNIISIIIVHILGLHGVLFIPYSKLYTVLWVFLISLMGGFGVTGGVHRLWCHRSYKAKLPLEIILVICYTIAGQNTIYDWVRDHRVHHRYSETEADPHNAHRGFFFSHVGWLMLKKKKEVVVKGATVDMSDILENSLLEFHRKYFNIFKLLLCFVIPVFVPPYFWNESWTPSIMLNFTRYMGTLNATWLVNSAAHIWGTKPFDKNIGPVENKSVAIFAMGEGWHNYHHVFPWDYKAAELGKYSLNWTTMIIDFFAKIGWAYDLRHPSEDVIRQTVLKHGDGSHPKYRKEMDVINEGKAVTMVT